MARPGVFPPPRELEQRGEPRPWPSTAAVRVHPERWSQGYGPSSLRRALQERGFAFEDPGRAGLVLDLSLDPGADLADGEYRLTVGHDGARAVASGSKGLQYACTTLVQLLDHPEGLVPLELRDGPDLPRRGLCWDVSRSRVPSMETLIDLVDLCARWKLDQLQLYVEHVFAYAGHEAVWRGSDPITPRELRSLESFARERHVELVPNQQSFGHMHRWLRLDRYRPLAECPDGVAHPFSREREPFSLCPTDPRALELLGELYDQLLEGQGSAFLNVGLDETFDLGRGRSAAACRERGVGPVYLDFLKGVHDLVAARGRRMQFWADVVTNHPELARDLPADAVPIFWGYDADHDFEGPLALAAGAPWEFGVAPGTSAWLSLGGRTRNLRANQARAARAARQAGASLYLTTEWGDRGHLQPHAVALPGVALGAAAGWNPAGAEALADLELGRVLDRDAYEAPGSGLGALALRLGEAGDATGAESPNSSPLARLLLTPGPFPAREVRGLTDAGLARAAAHLDGLRDELAALSPERPAARRAAHELGWAARVLAWVTRWARAESGRTAGAVDDGLRRELEELAEEHRGLWLQRSRPGGLDESLRWLRTPLG